MNKFQKTLNKEINQYLRLSSPDNVNYRHFRRYIKFISKLESPCGNCDNLRCKRANKSFICFEQT